jgi:hypothetical protein
MLFLMPHPAQWDTPPAKYNWPLRRLLAPFYPVNPAWPGQLNAYIQAQEAITEQINRYIAEQQNYEAMMAQYQAEGEYMAEVLPFYLHRLRLSHWRKVQEKKTERVMDHIDYCQVQEWHLDESAYYFRVDTANLPWGLTIKMFLEPEVADTLSVNFYAKTWVEANPSVQAERPGLWIIVEHRAGRGLVPANVDYSALYKAIPKTAPPLTFAVGVGANNKALFADMDEIYTVLLAGQKGSGKSNFLHNMICTWLQRASPAGLRLFLTDLKGALEFYNYNGVPHLGGDVDIKMRLKKGGELQTVRLGREVLSEPYQVAPMLRYMEAEMSRRQKIMQGKAANIRSYNHKNKKNKLSVWILVIDELATLADSENRKECYKSLAELVRKGRAVGLYCVLATQVPDKTVLTRQIAGNLDFRIVGYLSDGASSGLALGDNSYDAIRISPDVKGRMIARWNKKTVTQTPYMGEMVIARIIKAAKENIPAEDTADLEIAQEIFSYSVEYLGGICHTYELFNHFRSKIAKHAIRRVLQKFEVVKVNDNTYEPIITIGNDEYYLLPSFSEGDDGKSSRQLVNIADFGNEVKRLNDNIRTVQSPQSTNPAEMVTYRRHESGKISKPSESVWVYDPTGDTEIEPDSDNDDEPIGDWPPEPVAAGPEGASAPVADWLLGL